MLVAREKPKTGYYLGQRLPGNFTQGPNLTPPVAKRRRVASTSARAEMSYTLRESMLLYVLLFFLIAVGVGVISQYGRIVACNYRIQHLHREMALLQEEKESLCIEVKRLGSLERIERIAVGELGLQYPEKRQWLVLSARGNEH
ncbi:MAG: cell division protein FtsL [Dethiobacteria bacterium]